MRHLNLGGLSFRKVLGLSAVSLTLFAGAYSYSQAQTAQQGVDLTVSPVFLDLRAEPGKSVTERIKVRNNSSSDITLAPAIKKLVSKDEKIDVIEPTVADEYIKWLTFDNSTYTIRPNEWGNIEFTLAVPEDAAFGYYYMVSLKRAKNPDTPEGQTALAGEVGVPLLLTVLKEGAISSAQLVNFKPTKNVNEYLPVNFEATLRNTGNVHIRPRGNIFIKKGSDSGDIAILEVNSENGRLLPDSQRTFMASWDDGFFVRKPVEENGQVKLDGNGQLVTKLAVNWNKLTSFRFGKYTANMVLVFDGGNRDVVLEGVTTFWVVPYTLIAGVLVAVVVLALVFRFGVKAYVNKQVQAANGKSQK